MPEPVKGKGRYMAGIDGLRAFAVLAVIAYHLDLSWASGGLLGVGIFFVLSGYLITDLLLNEWQQNGRLDFKDFWLRRARRLLPALIIMLAVVVVWVILFERSHLSNLRGDVISALLYVSNWWFIFHEVSYFELFGPPSPLGHLWSLAVEEQFYLIWPLLLWLGLRYIQRRGILMGLTLAAAAASALAMALIYQPGTDPTRVYDGTDTRAFGLLIGAVLAFVWPSQKLSAAISRPKRIFLDLAGGISLLVLLVMIWQTNQYEAVLYRGGLVLFSVMSAVLVAVLAHPASLMGKAFGSKPMCWLGVRSYGIYLWHYPIIVLTAPVMNTGGVNLLQAALQVAACIILAALSWWFVEEPIRRWPQMSADTRRRLRLQCKRLPAFTLVYTAGAIMAVGVLCANMTGFIAKATANDTQQSDTITAVSDSKTQEARNDEHISEQTEPPQNSTPDVNTEQANSAAADGENSGSNPPEITMGQGITVIGDSIMLDAEPYLQELLPGIVIDAKIGRQLIDSPPVVSQLKAEGKLGSRVILELGTNGPFTKEQLVGLLDLLGPVRQVILMNTRVPRPWQDVVNQILAQVAETYPHVILLDWYSASADKNTIFYPDGVHLTPAGAESYAELIASAVQLPEN